jgi:hypothetical protein
MTTLERYAHSGHRAEHIDVSLLIALSALTFLMVAAYRGFSRLLNLALG